MKNADFAAAIQAILDWTASICRSRSPRRFTNSGGSRRGRAFNLAPLGKKQPLDAATNAKLLDLLAETIAEMQKRYGKWNVAWGELHKVGRGGVYFPVGGADYESGDKEANFSETLFDVRCKDDTAHPGHFIADNGSMATILMFFYKDGVRSFTCTPWGPGPPAFAALYGPGRKTLFQAAHEADLVERSRFDAARGIEERAGNSLKSG